VIISAKFYRNFSAILLTNICLI